MPSHSYAGYRDIGGHLKPCHQAWALFACIVLAGAVGACGQNAGQPVNRRLQALQLEQQGKYTEAQAEWQRYLEFHAQSSEANAHLGYLEARQEHFKDAVAFYRKALALQPSAPGVKLNLGLALFKDGAMKDAASVFLSLYRTAAVSSQERERLGILVGMSYYGASEFAAAVPFLKEAASHDAQNLTLRLALTHSCLWSKQYQCVLDTYHEILELNAESAEADMLAGEALDEMKDIAGAIEQFRAAVKADPHMPDVHFGLGYLLWTKRRYAEAEPEFAAELENNSMHLQALMYLGDVKMKLNKPEDAVPLLVKAVQIDASAELAHLDLGQIAAAAGHNEDALKELSSAAKLAPKDVNVHWRLGRLYKAMGRQQEAKAEFAKASSITEAADTALINKMNAPSATAAGQRATEK